MNTVTTTIEELIQKCGELGAVLKYGDKVLTTSLTYNGFDANIYEFIESEEETGLSYVECRLKSTVTSTVLFDDNGDAMKWCYEHMNDTKKSEGVILC